MTPRIIKNTAKRLIYKFLVRFISTSRGRSILTEILYDYPQICIEAFGKRTNLSNCFENVTTWSEQVDAFEDLYFLFSCTQLNMGIANLCLDEAAYIYKIIKSLRSANMVEIGRFKGGGTFLMAAAMDGSSRLRSYDIHVKMTKYFNGKSMDSILQKTLDKYGLAERVDIIVGNSCETDVGKEPVDLIFIDGDHSFEGVKKDFLHWYKTIKPSGHVLFHDASKSREFTTYHEEVARFVEEVEKNFSEEFYKVTEVGSIAHFVRKC